MNNVKFLIASAAFVLFLAPARAAEMANVRSCSPSFSQVRVDGGLSVQVNCGSGSKALEQLAADMTRWLRRAKLNQDQLNALFEAYNNMLPGVITQLDRMEEKQDQAISGISEILKRNIKAGSTVEEIDSVVSALRGYIPGTELTACDCYAQYGAREKVGAREKNVQCASGWQTVTNCAPKDKRMCTSGVSAYSPYQTVCE